MPGGRDVAADGKVTPTWSSTVEGRLVSTAPGEYHTKFYVDFTKTDTEVSHGPLTLTSSDSSIAVPSFTPESGSSGVITRLGVILSVFYHCRKPGSVVLSASLPLRDFMTVTWRWKKVCGDELPAHISVGTEAGQDDVIAAGVVARPWNATKPTVDFPPDRVRQALWLSSTQDQAFFPFDVIVDPPIAVIVVNGHFNPEDARTAPASFPADQPVSFVAANQNAPLTFDVTCISAGRASVSVRVAPYALHDKYRPVTFGWALRCGGIPRPAFAVSTQLLTDGLSRDDANVAVDGRPTAAWNASGYTADSLEQVTYLHYALLPAGPGEQAAEQRMRETVVTVEPPIATASTVDAAGNPLKVPPPPATNTAWHTLGVRFICRSVAQKTARVTVSIRPGIFDPVDVVLTKSCGGFKPGFSVSLPGSFLLDGSLKSDDSIAVVRNGRATAAFDHKHPSAEVIEAGTIPFTVRFGTARPGDAPGTGPAAGSGSGSGSGSGPNSTSVDSGSGSGTGSPARRRLLAAAPARHSNATGPSRAGVQGGGKALVEAPDGEWLSVSLHGAAAKGGLFREGEAYALEMRTDCPSWGFFPSVFAAGFSGKTARVQVTLPIVSFQPGVFSVLARCDGWIQSAWGIVVFAVFVLLLIGLIYFAFQGSGSLFAKLRGYSPVEQSDTGV